MKLHEVDTSGGLYCGPTSIAAATGKPVADILTACAAAIANHRKMSDRQMARLARNGVAGMFETEVSLALSLLLDCKISRLTWSVERQGSTRSVRDWYAERSQRIYSRTCIIGLGNRDGHFITVREDQAVDTRSRGRIVPFSEIMSTRRPIFSCLPIPEDLLG